MLICVMKILGISRDPKYSPNATDRDAAIFQATASRLARHHHVSLISEEFFISVDLEEFDAVFSMARSHSVLTALAEAESTMGLQVFNAAHALLAATRVKQAAVFQEKGVPQPALLYASRWMPVCQPCHSPFGLNAVMLVPSILVTCALLAMSRLGPKP